MTVLLEKHIFDIRRKITKYKHTHTAFPERFNKKLAKQFLHQWMLKSLKTLKKYQ